MDHRQSRKTFGLGSSLVAGICLILVSACSTPAPPAPTPPAAPPPIGLSGKIIELAAGYVAHTERVQGLSSAFVDGGEVAHDLITPYYCLFISHQNDVSIIKFDPVSASRSQILVSC